MSERILIGIVGWLIVCGLIAYSMHKLESK
jgi:hypothetical protein